MRWKYIIVKCFMDNLFNVLSNPFGYASALATVKQQPKDGHGGSDYFHRTRSHSGHFRKANAKAHIHTHTYMQAHGNVAHFLLYLIKKSPMIVCVSVVLPIFCKISGIATYWKLTKNLSQFSLSFAFLLISFALPIHFFVSCVFLRFLGKLLYSFGL